MPPCGLLSPRLFGQYYPTIHTRPDAFNGSLSESRLILPCFTRHSMVCQADEILADIHRSISHTGSGLYTYTLLTSSPFTTVPFFPITYQYHIRHSSPHTQLIILPHMVFECRHNIWNQPVSTAIPSPSLFRDITTIRKHQHLGEILKYVLSYAF